MRAFGNPLYVNGQLFQQPVTISHVPGPGVAGVLRGFGIDPSMGGLGSYAAYRPTPGMPRGFGADAPVVVSPPSSAPAPMVFQAPTPMQWALALAGIASTAGLVYHGYKRNDSIGWAIGWGLLGGLAPIVAWPVAVAQGYGKRKGMTPNARRRGVPGWDVFLNGKKIDHIVHVEPTLHAALGLPPADAAEVKATLVRDGYDPKIVVRRGKGHTPNRGRKKRRTSLRRRRSRR